MVRLRDAAAARRVVTGTAALRRSRAPGGWGPRPCWEPTNQGTTPTCRRTAAPSSAADDRRQRPPDQPRKSVEATEHRRPRTGRQERRLGPVAAWLVHIYTATGTALALLTVMAV